MNRLRDQRGQAAVLSFIFLGAILAMCAAVLDVGAWYRADRALQATADAAALAGAQALPDDPGHALALADEYLAKNGGAAGVTVSLSARHHPNDTISVEVTDTAPGLFSRVFGIESTGVGARASALAAAPSAARWVAPITVNWKHPLMPGAKGCEVASPTCSPTYGVDTELELIHLHSPGSGDAAGAFGLIDLAGGNGSVGTDELAKWMEDGMDKAMPLGIYHSVPSSKFNSVQFKGALGLRKGTEVLFPVYKTITESGSNAEFTIVGWVGFIVRDFETRGSDGKVFGHFTRFIAQGIQAESGGDPGYGVRVISLVE